MFSFLKKIYFKKCHSEQCEESHSKAVFSERGSVMLEVIAVLALMGVMGAMLFLLEEYSSNISKVLTCSECSRY